MIAGSRTVLLAEDDDNDVIFIRRAFARRHSLGRLVTVADGEHVIPYLRGTGCYADRQNHPFPDVLILDRRMRALSGLDVLVWLRSEPRFRALPVLVLSNGFPPDELAAIEALGAAHAVKTILASELPQILDSGIKCAVQMAAEERHPSGRGDLRGTLTHGQT